eukprot:7380006-Prymnesium_polylepis.1
MMLRMQSSRQQRGVEAAPLLPLGEEPLVERVERRHVIGRQLKVEDVDVLRDALRPHAARAQCSRPSEVAQQQAARAVTACRVPRRAWACALAAAPRTTRRQLGWPRARAPLGQRHVAVLHRPPHQHLRGRGAVPRGDRAERRVGEPQRARERRVGDEPDAALAAEGVDLVLAQKGVQLHLVGRGHDARGRRHSWRRRLHARTGGIGERARPERGGHPCAQKATPLRAPPTRLDEPEALRLLERAPVGNALRRVERRVDEVEVGRCAEQLDARAHRLEHRRVAVLDPRAVLARPHLGRDVDAVTRHARVPNRSSDVLLVLVEAGSVEVTVADAERLEHDAVRRLSRRRVVEAEADRRDGVAVAERHTWHVDSLAALRLRAGVLAERAEREQESNALHG